jgi:hypothetical protein
MTNLRRESLRPGLLVDPRARRVGDNVDTVGTPGPFGRERCVYALPLNGQPPMPIRANAMLIAPNSNFVADATDVIVGAPGLWIPRLLTAGFTEDTRRLTQ